MILSTPLDRSARFARHDRDLHPLVSSRLPAKCKLIAESFVASLGQFESAGVPWSAAARSERGLRAAWGEVDVAAGPIALLAIVKPGVAGEAS